MLKQPYLVLVIERERNVTNVVFSVWDILKWKSILKMSKPPTAVNEAVSQATETGKNQGFERASYFFFFLAQPETICRLICLK